MTGVIGPIGSVVLVIALLVGVIVIAILLIIAQTIFEELFLDDESRKLLKKFRDKEWKKKGGGE